MNGRSGIPSRNGQRLLPLLDVICWARGCGEVPRTSPHATDGLTLGLRSHRDLGRWSGRTVDPTERDQTTCLQRKRNVCGPEERPNVCSANSAHHGRDVHLK